MVEKRNFSSYQESTKFLSLVLSIIGYNIFQEGWRPTKYTIFVFVQANLMVFRTFYHIATNKLSLAIATEGAGLGFAGMQCLVKYGLLLVKREKWQQLLDKAGSFYDGFSDHPQFQQYVTKYCVLTKKFSKYLFLMYFICGCELVIVPLIMPDPLKLILVYHLPYLPLEQATWYWLNYAEQFILVFLAVQHYCGIDGIITMLILNACCRVEVIIHMLNSINNIYTLNVDATETEAEREDRITDILKSCIYEHVRVQNFISDMDEQFGVVYLQLFFTDTLIMVMSMNVIVTEKMTSVYLLLFGALSQLFLSCYYGNKLLIESDRLLNATTAVDWNRMSVKNQKMYLLFLKGTQKSLSVSAIFSQVNLQVFLDVIKSSYSYFTLLQNFS